MLRLTWLPGPPLPGGLPEIAAPSSWRAGSQGLPGKPRARGAACSSKCFQRARVHAVPLLVCPSMAPWLCLQQGAQCPSCPQQRRGCGSWWDRKADFFWRSSRLVTGRF